METRVAHLLRVPRPWSFPMTWISAATATALALSVGSPAVLPVVLLFVGLTAAHAATNVLNDVFDFRHGVDAPGAPTTRYRTHPLVESIFSQRFLVLYAVMLYATAAACGLYFTVTRGWPVAAVALAGGAASVFYTGDPVSYKHKALGESSVFLMWGPLMVGGGLYALTGSWTGIGRALLVSAPHGAWVALVLFANNLKDIDFDGEVQIRTLGTILGRRKGLRFYAAGIAGVYALTAAEIAVGVLPVWAAATVVSAVPAVRLISTMMKGDEVPADADPRTAKIGTLYGVLLVASLLLPVIGSA